ncbi:glycosyltransferase family 2 protein [Hwangdonia lutea]|uniref:Glycosyltransferase family A protein n=1 Tax=Hwangdonia lutea TaxID=3075823 RepID=A0AA97EPW8_9FLAO|nr:glycosyltransferase family A protein [Hwangdonia sp. SCSIO 19198]WOD43973.1 glycosyltransferase family A protein [Hwangdonia sp. SCSIO 19198]
MIEFSILITTKNRLDDLKRTLSSIVHLLNQNHVECIICDDGSSDGTSNFIKSNYDNIRIIMNEKSKGLIYSRNRLLNLTKAKYAITLDDDAHLVSQNALECIKSYFSTNKKCAVMAFRIFWGKVLPENLNHSQNNSKVRGFVGCGHAWRLEAWNDIPNYPAWFVFYGEEDFASYQLFKKKWEVHYTPDILVHHRVDVKSRKGQKDYGIRLRRSLRSGWYLYFLFHPLKTIPKRFLYTLWIQLKTKVLKGDFRALLAIFQALGDLVINTPRLVKNANRLSRNEFTVYSQLQETKLYWTPND